MEGSQMALGRRRKETQAAWVATTDLPKSPGHVFFRKLNEILRAADFDRRMEDLCEPYYADGIGRPGIPPGVYFRMLLVGYFEGIASQRGIAWRCADSLSLREFLGLAATESSPDHSSLTKVRKRLPLEAHLEVFCLVLEIAANEKLLKGKQVAVDATTLEANAAMKSIVRRDSGEDWKQYLTRLMREEELLEEDEEPTDEDLRRFDKQRKNKKVSNDEWTSLTDPDSRITKMKDGRTHLAYKAENVVDLETDLVLAAEVYPADYGDSETLVDSLMQAQGNVNQVREDKQIEEVAADKGYHAAGTLELADALGFRTYIPEPKQRYSRRWTDKPEGHQRVVYNNRRRTKRTKGRQMQRTRSELVERTFAHMCETGGARRTWLQGLVKVRKRWLIQAAARNLGLILRNLFGIGTARSLQADGCLTLRLFLAWIAAQLAPMRLALRLAVHVVELPWRDNRAPATARLAAGRRMGPSSTGC
jgi:transposase